MIDDSDNEGQNEELKKVKVVKIVKEKSRVSGNQYLKAQELKSLDLKQRVRLAHDLSETDFK